MVAPLLDRRERLPVAVERLKVRLGARGRGELASFERNGRRREHHVGRIGSDVRVRHHHELVGRAAFPLGERRFLGEARHDRLVAKRVRGDEMRRPARRLLGRSESARMRHDDALRVREVGHALPFPARFALPRRPRRVGDERVVGQDVDEDSLVEPCLDRLVRGEARAGEPYLAEQRRLMGVRLGRRHDVRVTEQRRRLAHEPVVVGARHAEVDVVVPRDEAAMPKRAKHRSRIEEVRDAELFAGSVDVLQDMQLGELELSQRFVVILHVSAIPRCVFPDPLPRKCAYQRASFPSAAAR